MNNNQNNQNNNKNLHNQLEEIVFDTEVLTEEDPISLLTLISNKTINKVDAWRILQLIHSGDLTSNLPQYGILTVFSLSKSYIQFAELFEQGCQMLRENNILTEEIEKVHQKRIKEILSQKGIDLYEETVIVTKSAKNTNKTNKNNKNGKPKNKKNN
jgi:hypothetical protein